MQTLKLQRVTDPGIKDLGELQLVNGEVLFYPQDCDVPLLREQFARCWGESFIDVRFSRKVHLSNPYEYFQGLPYRFSGQVYISVNE